MRLPEENYISKFEDYLINEKRAASNTQVSYMRDIHQFEFYLGKAKKSLDEADNDTMKSYMEYLKKGGKSAATISRCMASLKCFYSYLKRIQAVKNNPLEVVKLDRQIKKLPQILTNEEVDLLLAQPDVRTQKGCRDRAMLEVLYATGMRVSELIALDVSDVNLEIGLIQCENRGKKRMIPLYPMAIKTLSEYMKKVRGEFAGETEKSLFVNTRGGRLSRQGFWKIIKGYQEKAHIKKDITPHTLRHSFAAHLLKNGADMHSLQMMMGHSDISSTQIYAKVIEQDIKAVYTRAHPRA